MKKNILITNDDGIDSKALPVLLKALKNFDLNIVIVVPDRERSAVSQSITLTSPIRMKQVKKNIYTIDGTPTDCVYLTILGALEFKPDLVISGINMGPNMGEDIFYSGTVAAAREACIGKIKSFSISINSFKGKFYFNTAAKFVEFMVRKILTSDLQEGIFFNINVPNVREELINGVKITNLGSRRYFDKLIKRIDPVGNPYFWLSGNDVEWKNEKTSDYFAVKNNYISVTPLHMDLTAYDYIKKLKSWKLNGYE